MFDRQMLRSSQIKWGNETCVGLLFGTLLSFTGAREINLCAESRRTAATGIEVHDSPAEDFNPVVLGLQNKTHAHTRTHEHACTSKNLKSWHWSELKLMMILIFMACRRISEYAPMPCLKRAAADDDRVEPEVFGLAENTKILTPWLRRAGFGQISDPVVQPTHPYTRTSIHTPHLHTCTDTDITATDTLNVHRTQAHWHTYCIYTYRHTQTYTAPTSEQIHTPHLQMHMHTHTSHRRVHLYTPH